jgi:hypothetical protein
MERTIEILKQYRQADYYVRTCLFLQFPDLRDVFQGIEFINLTLSGTGKDANHSRECDEPLSENSLYASCCE